MNAANDNRPAVLDLFSGIGGFSLGLERAGFRTAAFCEIDPMARAVLAKHWPNVPVFNDVSTLTKGALDDRGIAIDGICGGFPCQDISLVGNGDGLAGQRSGLWSEFRRLIEEIQPNFAIIENVSALRNRGLDQVLRSLSQIGYDAEWHCIPAAAVGAPHRRDRIWIVAYPACVGLEEREGQDWKPNAGSILQGWLDPIGKSGWPAEPAVCRVANGVPGRVDRLKQLGNAVVPQIPEMIGRALLARMCKQAANDNRAAAQGAGDL